MTNGYLAGPDTSFIEDDFSAMGANAPNLASLDLSNADFGGANLTGMDLSNDNLTGCTVRQCQPDQREPGRRHTLASADLEDANLHWRHP